VPASVVEVQHPAQVMKRSALFEIGAMVEHGVLHVSFAHSSLSKHQDRIQRWSAECKTVLRDISDSLLHMPPEFTLADFPLLPISYNELPQLLYLIRTETSAREQDIEEIMMASYYQEDSFYGTLMRNHAGLYHFGFEIDGPLDIDHLEASCHMLTMRHSCFRTLFVTCQKQVFQVVLQSAMFKFERFQGNRQVKKLRRLSLYKI
jgi:hypothetical protein